MSGVKDSYVQLRQSQLDHLMKNCNRVGNLEADIAKRVKDNQLLQQQMDSQRRQEEQRHKQLESQLGQMSSHMQEAEKESQRKIKKLRDKFNADLQGVNQRIDQLGSVLNKRIDNLSDALNEQRKDLQSQIKNIDDKIAAKEADQAKRAKIWLQDTQSLLNVIKQGYDHEKFKPNALNALTGELSLVENNIRQGDYQAAIATTQQTFLRGQQLRLDLEQLTLEWNAYLQAARKNVAEVLALCDSNLSAKFTFSTDIGAEEINAEIDFWTEGKLTQLREKVVFEHQRLDNTSLTLEEIKQIINSSEQYRQQSEALAQEARQRIIASQIRQNIGQTIETSLQEMGFDVIESVWEGTDTRRALHVKLENSAGDQMVTIIKPGDNALGYHVTTHLFDNNSNNEEFRLQRLNAMLRELEKAGLNCGPLKCAEGTINRPSNDRERLNFEQVARQNKQQGV